jgi:hypothetical protein
MTQLPTLLTETNASDDTLVSLMISALPHVEEKTWSQIRAELNEELGAARLAEFQAQFEEDPAARMEAASLWLAAASENRRDEETIAAVVEEAGEQLAVIELAIVALAALYAIHVVAKPKAKTIKMVKRGADGSYEKVEQVDYQSFSEPVKGLLGILGQKSES